MLMELMKKNNKLTILSYEGIKFDILLGLRLFFEFISQFFSNLKVETYISEDSMYYSNIKQGIPIDMYLNVMVF